MVRITRLLWLPDTCNCRIYEFFDADSNNKIKTSREVDPEWIEGGHEIGTVRCAAHKQHKDAQEHYTIVLEENQRKNITHGKIGIEKTDISWKFTGESPDRVLHFFVGSKKVAEVSK